MVNAYNPIADPIGFIVFLFIAGVGDDTITTILKLTILSSIIAFPFTLLGRQIYLWVDKKIKSVHLLKLFVTSTITLFFSLIIIRLWYVIWGSQFLAVDLTGFVSGFAVALAISFVFAMLGDYLNYLLHQKFDVPSTLALYTIDFVVCLVFLSVTAIVHLAI